jgi:hypothetical protein
VVLLDAVCGGAVVVEVRQVFSQYSLEVAAVEDQDPVQQLAAYGADLSFGDRVPSRCSRWRAQGADGFAGEHGVEGVVNLLSRSLDQHAN